MRAGVEDCELLYMVADSDKEKADALCKTVMRAFDDYELNVKAFEDNYVRLLEAADTL
jgi:hypothetical protein